MKDMISYNSSQFHIDIPKDVKFILNKLNEAGFEAYAVGGCIRDTILGRIPGDWDITTSAHPMQVKALFRRTIDTGIQHGTVTVMLGNTGYEITTYRIDGEYADNRHPESVQFTSNLIEDLKRRDFTINAMAYSDTHGLVDEFGGIKDLENKVIKCVGNAEERFKEDALRILRAVRFSAQLGFEIEDKTKSAISKLSPNLVNISKERIQVELEKLLMSDNPWRIRTAYELGITKVILPEFDRMMETPQNTKYHCYNVGEHTIKVMEATQKEHYIRWAALLHDIGKPDTRTTDENGQDHFHGHDVKGAVIAHDILKRLKFDNKTVSIVSAIVRWHRYHPIQQEMSKRIVRRSIYKIGPDIYPYYIDIMEADYAGKSEIGRQIGYKEFNYIKETYKEILQENECLAIKDLAVNGKDLIAAGIKPGVKIGEMLEKLLKEVLDNPSLNTKEQLLDIVNTSNKQTEDNTR